MNDPLKDIDAMLQFVTECRGELPGCFIDLYTGELVTTENFGEWLKSKSG
jgi:hypothetical protein